MKRRDLILGLGTASAGVTGIAGTGAFSSVRAKRSITINTKIDETAYLSLEELDGEHATVNRSTGTVEFEFGELDTTGGDGEGLNLDAKTRFTDVLALQNRGNQTVQVFGQSSDDTPLEVKLLQTSGVNQVKGAKGKPLTAASPSDPLGPGDQINIGFHIDTVGTETKIYNTSLAIIAASDAAQGYEL